MPFKSKHQMKACFAKNDPNWDCQAWAKETPNIKSLPQHAKSAADQHKAYHGKKKA